MKKLPAKRIKSEIWDKIQSDLAKPKTGKIKYKELIDNIYRSFELQGLGIINDETVLYLIYELMGEYNKGDYPLRRYSAGKKVPDNKRVRMS